MPISLIYLLILFAFIFVAFLVTKRPIYQIMAVGFVLILALTNTWTHTWEFIEATFSTSLLYTIFAFLVLSQILDKTGVINDCINVVLALIGRVPGGAGYVAIISSPFMGAISGSGPGNVAATGVITIPSMKKSGFPAHLAANVEASASTLGNMIPPSGVIVASFGCLTAYFGSETISIGKFWLILWGISLWFVLQRIITLMVFCKWYKVKPMDKSEIPSLRESIKKGWKSLLLPVIILFPFILDYLYKDTLFTSLIGADGASAFSKSLLLFIPGMAAIYSLLISHNRELRTVKGLLGLFEKSVRKVVPTLITLVFAYSIGEVLDYIGAGASIAEYIGAFNLGRVAIAFILPLVTAFLGMIFPGSAQIAIFGTSLVTLMVSCGVDPILAAAMLPCICGAMSGIIPPVAVCTLTAMSIAESEMKPTMINCFIWVALHYAMSVLIMLGIIPTFGL
ncbi:MAG: TRAP transporter large permease subunit [Clostridia bacterium]|nr:TRAP transporter large permease subunit [Clostridia bacterium]